MSEEAKVLAKVVKELKRRLPGAVIFKHSDIRTAGIPDLSVSFGGHTAWVEGKYLRDETASTVKKAFGALQLATAVLLNLQSEVVYLVAYEGGRRAALIKPTDVREVLLRKGGLPLLLEKSFVRGSTDEVIDAMACMISAGLD